MKNILLSLISKERKILIYGLVTSFTVFLFYLVAFYTPTYLVKTKLFVRNIPQDNIVSPYNDTSILNSESGFSNPLFNIIQILKSDELANRMKGELDKKYPKDMKKFKGKDYKWKKSFSKLINAKIEPSSDIIKVSLAWINKEAANDVLDIFINQFKQLNLEIRKNTKTKHREYLDKQVNEISKQLSNARAKVKDFKTKNLVTNVASESKELIKARVDLERQVELLKGDIGYYNKKLANLSSQLNVPNAATALRATAIGSDPYLITLTRELAIAEQKYANLKATFTDNYPDVIAIKNEIKSIQKNIVKRQKESLGKFFVKRGIYDTSSQNLVVDMARAQAEKASLNSRLYVLTRSVRNLRAKEASLPRKDLGLKELEGPMEALRDVYKNAKQKQLEAQIKENEIVDNIFNLGRSSKPQGQFYELFFKLIGFLLLGALGALGVAWIKEGIDDKWFNSEEIERVTGKRVLGVIPWLKEKDTQLDSGSKLSPVIQMAYRNLAINVVNKSYINDNQVISFISTQISKRKSSYIYHLAANISSFGKSVVVIDTDFSNVFKMPKEYSIKFPPANYDILDVINQVNKELRLSKSIDNEKLGQLIQNALIPVSVNKNNDNTGFYYLGTNKNIENIYDYIATAGFKKIIEFLRQHNEFVLLDSPAKPHIDPEISVITSIADAVTIISAMTTNRQMLINIIDKLNKENTKILGIITREIKPEIEILYSQDWLDNADYSEKKELQREVK